MRPYTEIQPDVVESVGYTPRNYCHVWRRPGTNNKFYFGQTYHAKAAFLRAHPDIVMRRLLEAQAYKKGHPSYVIGGREMAALFPWPDELLEGDICELFSEAVKKREGQKTLIAATPGEAVSDLRRLGNVLSAGVKSKSSTETYDVAIRNIFLTPEGDIDVIYIDCECKEHTESGKKGDRYTTNVWDLHVAAVGDEFTERRSNPNPWKKPVHGKGRYIERSVFNPFTFATNWVRQANMLVPTSIHRAMLEVDMNIAHYLLGQTYAGINRKVSGLPNEYSEALLRAAKRGEVKRELLRHGAKKRPESERTTVEAEKEVLRKFYAAITAFGYEYECLYVEMGWPAIRFENRDSIIGFVPGRGAGKNYKPPYYVVRRKTAQRPSREDLCRQDAGEKNPFKQLNFRQVRFDDHTAVDEETSVRVPTRLWLPELEKPEKIPQPAMMKDAYRAAIRRWSRYPETDLKRAGLFY